MGAILCYSILLLCVTQETSVFFVQLRRGGYLYYITLQLSHDCAP